MEREREYNCRKAFAQPTLPYAFRGPGPGRRSPGKTGPWAASFRRPRGGEGPRRRRRACPVGIARCSAWRRMIADRRQAMQRHSRRAAGMQSSRRNDGGGTARTGAAALTHARTHTLATAPSRPPGRSVPRNGWQGTISASTSSPAKTWSSRLAVCGETTKLARDQPAATRISRHSDR